MNRRPKEEKVARRPFVVSNGNGLRRLSGPAVVMDNPKHVVNLASMIRNCAAFGVGLLCYTGDRVLEPTKGDGDLRGRDPVHVIHHDFPLQLFDHKVVFIGVEILPNAVSLPYFEHPENAVYVFGPEDGSISAGLRGMCHQFVSIPTIGCLNVAQAGGVVLYDRRVHVRVGRQL